MPNDYRHFLAHATRRMNEIYAKQLHQQRGLVVSNVAFNHSRATSMQYGVIMPQSLFVVTGDEQVLRVHPTTLESAFKWTTTFEQAINKGITPEYLINENFIKPYSGRDLELKSEVCELPDLSDSIFQKLIDYLGM